MHKLNGPKIRIITSGIIIFHLLIVNVWPVTFVYAQESTASSQLDLHQPSPTLTPVPTPTQTVQPVDWAESQSTDSAKPEEIDEPSPSPTVFLIPSQTPTPTPTSELLFNQSLRPTISESSAIIRGRPYIIPLTKDSFRSTEQVSLGIENGEGSDVSIRVVSPQGKDADVSIYKQVFEALLTLTIAPKNSIFPGKYRVVVTDISGNQVSQDFYWGALGINVNKSMYKPHEQAHIFMAVLNDKGNMACDAELSLKITEVGQDINDQLSTKDGSIHKTANCKSKNVNDLSDFETTYTLGDPGIYTLHLTATTPNGQFAITDTIHVEKDIPFEIQRTGPTRIFPPRVYPMTIKIKPEQDFTGKITELVPAQFVLSKLQGAPDFEEETIDLGKQTDDRINLGMPFEGNKQITLGFGEDVQDPYLKGIYARNRLIGHDGVDYSMPVGTSVLAVDDGKVILAGDGAYGTTMVLEHSWGRSYYGHLSETLLQKEQHVHKGQKIALSGISGLTTGPHLHFGMKLNKHNLADGYYGKIDPLPYLTHSLPVTGSSVKKLTWNVSIKKDDTVTLAYVIKAPLAGPQSYIIGPLTIEKTPNSDQKIEEQSPFVLGASSETEFIEMRQWQIAADTLDSPQDSTADSRPVSTIPLQSPNVQGVSTDNCNSDLEDLTLRNNEAFAVRLDCDKNTMYAHDKARKKAGFKLRNKKTETSLAFELKSTKDMQFSRSNKTVTYKNIDQNGILFNLLYTLSKEKIKEEFVIKEKPDQAILDGLPKILEFVFDVTATGLRKEISDDTVQFVDEKTGEIVYTLPKLTYEDASGKSGVISLNFDDQNHTATMSIDTDFLEKATYPVIIDPTVIINTSSVGTGTAYSTQKHYVVTSDGTHHVFIQVGTQTATCGGSSKSGLLWFTSTDSGATWTCQSQLSSSTNPTYNASATVDASDNIYLVYSTGVNGGVATNDTFYRKLTYTGGGAWTVESEQTVLDASASTGYTYSVIELEGTTRIWLATRYFDATNYQVSAYYSDGLGAAPTWTQSVQSLDTANTTNNVHNPSIVRFGSKMGILYNNGGILWRFRADSDGLTTWVPQSFVTTTNTTAPTLSAVGDTQGRIYLHYGTSFTYYNGTNWSVRATVDAAGQANGYNAISTDGTNVWVFYGLSTGLSAGLTGPRKLVYKKGVPPFAAADFDSAATEIVNYHGVFDKYWSFVASAYTDDTTDAGNTTTADTQMVSNTADIAYFGKSQKYDAVSWDLSTNGVGGTITWEYCSAVDGSTVCTTWSTLTFTVSSNTNFTADGWGAFTAPSDWVAAKVNSESTAYFYVRARATGNYSTSPVGVEMATIPQINWPDFVRTPVSNNIYGIWIENANAPARIRTSSVSVTTGTAGSATANISPVSLAYSAFSTGNASRYSMQRKLVRTSDGTLHAFIQQSPTASSYDQLPCGGSTSTNNTLGLNWIYSTDTGSTWTCGGNVSTDTTNEYQASATVDSSDNIYIVYSRGQASGAGTEKDVFYRKITKGSGATWTVEAEQTVLDGTAGVGYTFATLALEGTTRIWLAARYFDGTNYQVTVRYSDGLGTAPTWTESITPLDTADTTASEHANIVVRYGSKIGVLYSLGSGEVRWRNRADSDGLTTWNAEEDITTLFQNANSWSFSAVGDSGGHVYAVSVSSSTVIFSYYNGSSWSTGATVSNLSNNNAPVSVTTDETDVWVYYLETDSSEFSVGLSGNRKLAYKKGVSPFAAGNFDTNPTFVNSVHDTFDKVWVYDGLTYEDETTDAGDTGSADVLHTTTSGMVKNVGDIIYFGRSVKFDGLSVDLSTSGSGGVIVWEYYNGSTWMPIQDFVVSSASSFSQDVYIAFIPHSNWATTAVNGEGTSYYYVRARVTTAFATAPVGVEMTSMTQTIWPSAVPISTERYLLWTENAGATNRVRFFTTDAGTSTPTNDQLLRHGNWFSGGEEQSFTF